MAGRTQTPDAVEEAPTRERVLVAMSGGVDSATSALLLKESGRDLIGVFIRNGVKVAGAGSHKSCCSVSDAADASRVASRLGIPFYALDAAVPFDSIVDGFIAEYRAGRTPNPCVRCNSEVKFGSLLDLAARTGCTRVATGHYARVERRGERVVLRKSVDSAKDQSYVLSTLTQDQLARAEFPLGGLRKDEVRKLARAAGLPVADKAESQEICFVPTGDYRDLLRDRAVVDLPGEVVDLDGNTLAQHAGVSGFTVGQRKGLGIAHGEPLYVVKIDAESRRVVVAPREHARFRGFVAMAANWVSRAQTTPGVPFEVTARIRHRHPGASARAVALDDQRFRVEFHEPEFAVTPGQTAVLYDGDEVLVSGTIEESWQEDRS